MPTVSPLLEYGRRLKTRSFALSRVNRLDARISAGRLAAVFVGVALTWLALRQASPWWLIGLPVATFAALAVWHDRVLRERDRLLRAMAFYGEGIARMEDRWHANGQTGARFLDESHLYTRDLDIFGAGSLFQLLSRARTHVGEDALAQWLSAPAAIPIVLSRQAAVAELRDCLDFREALATAGGASGEIDTVALTSWASADRNPISFWIRGAALVLSIGIIGAGVWWATGGPAAPVLAFVVGKMILTRPSRHAVSRAVRSVEYPLRQLDILADTLTLIEQRVPHCPALAALRDGMMSGDVVPSKAIVRLKRLADMLEWRRNAIFAPISAAFSWPLHLAAAIDEWREEFGPKVRTWLETVGEYEALSSLAAYSYEHPSDPFPVLLADGPATFDGTCVGHPLVPEARMVRNNVGLATGVRLWIVSGSNMSGKSTLLRTVGVNVVLAMAGAPVRAARLSLTPLAIGATLHIHDSLQDGRSRFFAEITRVRGIVDLAGRQPAPLFLLDELFQGTNSHDRRIGAEALLLSLMERGAIGLTTTHDLALTAISDQSGGKAVNVHFDDRLERGELVFDYQVRPGPVAHSNALALMRAVGLPVPAQ